MQRRRGAQGLIRLLGCALLVLALVVGDGIASGLPAPSVGEAPPPTTPTPRPVAEATIPPIAGVRVGTATPHSRLPQPTPQLVERLRMQPMPTRSIPTPQATRAAESFSLGAQRRFWIHDLGGGPDGIGGMREITATLRWAGEHLTMWVEDDDESVESDVNDAALAASGAFFDGQIYPTNLRYFGPEGNPPWGAGLRPALNSRLLVLNARFQGAAGYFASANSLPRAENPYSNEQEMFVMNVAALSPGSAAYNAVLAHEFQHMIHWHANRGQAAWLNEGASELAEDVNGFGHHKGNLRAFGRDPNLQLNHWPADMTRLNAHYGASYLLMRYILDRFGPEMVRAIVQGQGICLDGLDTVLASQDAGMSFDELFADWLLANALDPGDVQSEWGYPTLSMEIEPKEVVITYPFQSEGELHQYGADYVEITPGLVAQGVQIHLQGAPTVRLVPTDPPSGAYSWWSNRGDQGHSTLQRYLDLRQVSGAVTLSMTLWYDIEPGWDYGYLRASIDGGHSWQYLRGAHTTDYNPHRTARGPGYTGRSGQGARARDPLSSISRDEDAPAQWVQETIDLSHLAGHKVLLSIDYVTDDAVHLPGLCIDDITLTIEGITVWRDDVDSAGEDGWHAEGFLKHNNRLPQRYLIQFATVRGDKAEVRRWIVDGEGQGAWAVPAITEPVDRALLVISAITRYTTERAPYRLEIDRGPEARAP